VGETERGFMQVASCKLQVAKKHGEKNIIITCHLWIFFATKKENKYIWGGDM